MNDPHPAHSAFPCLQNAQTAIPKGTLLAILVTTLVYLGIAWQCGLCVMRDAVGPTSHALAVNGTNETYATWENQTEVMMLGNSDGGVNVTSYSCTGPGVRCKYGLLNDMRVRRDLLLL